MKLAGSSVAGAAISLALFVCEIDGAQNTRTDVIDREIECSRTMMDSVASISSKTVLDIPQVPSWCSLLDLVSTREAVTDCELYVEQEGKGTPIVLIHGGPGATHHYFHPSFSRAARFASVIYYDQRGCGASDWNAGEGYTLGQAVADLDQLRERVGSDRWVLLGHSYGGLVAQSYALQYPEHVAGLILVGASPGFVAFTGPMRTLDFLSEKEEKRIAAIQGDPDLTSSQRIYNAFLNGDWKRQYFCEPNDEHRARIALYEWKHDSRFRSAILAQLSGMDLRGLFDDCPIPTLIVEGRWDLTWGADKPTVLQRNHPNAQLVVLDHAGHFPFLSNSTEFFRVLREFVESLPPQPSPNLAAWKQRLANRGTDGLSAWKRLLRSAGWGFRSSVRIVEAYTPESLDDLQDPNLLLRTAFALYDVARYNDALAVFRRLLEAAERQPVYQAVALIWQGHMLDLLDRREEAVACYRRAQAMNVSDAMGHSQYRMTYKPSAYAKQRMGSPFVRVENQDERE